jgi:hypothetical protein
VKFVQNSGPEKRKQQPIPSDPNIVTSDLEEADIAKGCL